MTAIDAQPDNCYCAGCVGMGPCDDALCLYGCGGRATTEFGACRSCEDEAMGRDIWPDGDEEDE